MACKQQHESVFEAASGQQARRPRFIAFGEGVFSYPKGHADNRPPRREGFILTSIEAAGSRRPAHDRGNGTDDSPHPRVGNAHSLHGGVTARVQEYVEGSQGPGEGVHPQRQQGDSWHSAGGSEADGEQGAVERARDTH